MTKNDLIMLQSLPLDIKVAKTKARIREYVEELGIDNVYVSYSGGKDSQVLLHIAQSMYPDIKAAFINTGVEFPETVTHVINQKRNGLNLDVIQPKRTFKQVVEKYGYPAISKEQALYIYQYKTSKSKHTRDMRINGRNGKFSNFTIAKKYLYLLNEPIKISEHCCHSLKKNPIKLYEKRTKRKPIVATMAYESKLRETSYLKTGYNSFVGKRMMSVPMSFWVEEDIYEYVKLNNITLSECYTKHKMDRTGCYGCLFGCHMEERKTGTNRIVRLKQTHPNLYNHLMNNMNYNYVMKLLKLKTGDELENKS